MLTLSQLLSSGGARIPGGMFTPQKLRGLFEESGLQVVKMTDVRSSETPSVAKEMGVLGILFFMIKSYWKILDKLLTVPRFRKAQKIDDRLPRSARTMRVTG